MADFRVMVPFICHFAAGVYGKDGRELRLPHREMFLLAKARGWSDDPDDPGGATMVDVTLATYSRYKGRSVSKDELRNITFEEWSDIQKRMYWDRCRADDIESQGLANLIVDWVWASGAAMIQRVQKLVGVKADGVVGPVTLGAINSADRSRLFARMMEERERYYRGCRGAWKYLRGWLRRLRAIREDGTFGI